jgi:hypothetical protein
MSAEQNVATFRRVIEEGFNKGNPAALDDCFAPTYLKREKLSSTGACRIGFT